jgi:hypothetical protein
VQPIRKISIFILTSQKSAVQFSNHQLRLMECKHFLLLLASLPMLLASWCSKGPPPTPPPYSGPPAGSPSIKSINTFDCSFKNCGAYFWKVNFELTGPSPTGGYLVQSISRTLAIEQCTGSKGTSVEQFWEAWKVEKGTDKVTRFPPGGFIVTALTSAFGVPPDADDLYSLQSSSGPSPSAASYPKEIPDTKGTHDIIGEARFYEGLTEAQLIAAGFSSGKREAPNLYSTTTAPYFWSIATPSLQHNVTYTWDCCTNPIPATSTTVRYTKKSTPAITIPCR